MPLAVGDTHRRLDARRRIHQGWSLGFKSLEATTKDVLVFDKKIMKGKGIEFFPGN